MSERIQAARAELLRLIERYVRPTNLGQQAYVKLSAAMDELHDAAREAERTVLTLVVAADSFTDEVKGAANLLNSSEGPAQVFAEGVDGKLSAGEGQTPMQVEGNTNDKHTPIEVATPSPGAIIQNGEVLVNGIPDKVDSKPTKSKK